MCRQSISLLSLLVAGFTVTTSIAFVLPAAASTRQKFAFVAAEARRQPLICLSLTSDVEVEAAAEASSASSPAAPETAPEAPASEIKEPTENKEPKRILTRERFTIFAGNLPFDTNEDKMKELFAAHGKVEIVNLPKDKNTGQPRGFAFVDMSSNEELEAAIKALDGQQFEGRALRVMKSVPKEQQEKKPDDNSGKIYVGNLPFTATKDSVMNFFEKYADIVELYLPMNPETGEARGFAFVTVKEEDAEKTIEATNGLDFEGRALTVNKPLPPGKKANKDGPRSPRQPQQPRTDRTKIYVGNLSFYTVPDTLYQVFEEFGTVHDCYFPEDTETGGSRGFAFITMDKEAAMNAINEIDGCELDGRQIRVNEAQPKGGPGAKQAPREKESSSAE